ncbi:hypothetical protein Dda_3087 [Drechslerella dactyloides]|uniref:PB1 domain-containing protein n=1 Tax=Drechslerella dactyloides TaxID=74499 RepID=A0AAD6J0T5_DREDA|nr:hypothetical protein Dda_3087 [Drechslerella dactyloides]
MQIDFANMSFKKEVYETWVDASERYDIGDFAGALAGFEVIHDASARIYFNIGIIYATIGEHEKAISSFNKALKKDQYLAIAYFQRGVSNFLIAKYDDALTDFATARQHMRNNKHIDYEQLGLNFSLYSCEVLFNRGLCHRHLGRKDASMLDLANAAREKKIPDRHEVIDEALRHRGEGYTVFSVPVGTIFRITEAKIRTAGHRPNQSADVKKTPTDSRPHQRSKSAITLPSHHSRKVSSDKNLPPIPTEKRRPATIATQKPRDHHKIAIAPPPLTSRTDLGRKLSISSNSSRPPLPLPPVPVDKYSAGSSNSSISSSSSSGSSINTSDDDYDYVPDYYGSEYSGWSEASRPSSGSTTDFVVLRRGERTNFGNMKKIKVKIHHDDLIVIYIDPTVSFRELMARMQSKLKLRGACKIKFKDEDGQQILLADEEDLDHAIDMCASSARKTDAGVGRMEIWVSDP